MDSSVHQPGQPAVNRTTTVALTSYELESDSDKFNTTQCPVPCEPSGLSPIEIADLSVLFQDIRISMRYLQSILPRHARPIAEHIQVQIDRGMALATLAGVSDFELYREERVYRAQLARRYPTLSRRELQICSLIHLGLTTKEIAERIHTSTRNVEHHRYRIRRKLQLPSEGNLATLLAAV